MTVSSDLARTLASGRDAVESALERALEHLLPAIPLRLREPVTHGVTSGGKRLRPILMATTWRACSTDEPSRIPAAIWDLAVSVELIHAYSLMHDDLPCMDDADLRRGRPTPHTLWGEEATALAGAALIPAAGLHLLRVARELELGDERRRDLLRVLAVAAGGEGMVGGQAMDLEGEGKALRRDVLDDLHARKTGALLTASLEMGAVAAGASASRRTAVARYGQAIGLAFQIADDVLDATATADALGKNPSDVELDKSTYVALLGVDGARREAQTHVGRAIQALDEAGLDAPELVALARYVVERDR